MRTVTIAAAIIISATAAQGDDRPVPEDVRASVEKALGEIGCKTKHIESDDTGGYEADDAVCADGRFDIHFDTQFKVVKKEKDNG